MSNETELLPCPFCGAPAKHDIGGAGVHCSSIPCPGHTTQVSAERWNRRLLARVEAQEVTGDNKSQIAWIIERDPAGYAYEELFFGIEFGRDPRWFKDANKALRFLRKEDAENCLQVLTWAIPNFLGENIYRNARATEHMWISTAPSPIPAAVAAEHVEEILHIVTTMDELKKLSNRDLVAHCLNTDAADYDVVCEMMDRLYPGWADDEALGARSNSAGGTP